MFVYKVQGAEVASWTCDLGRHRGPHAWKGSVLGSILCWFCLEILISISTRGLAFFFCTRFQKLCDQSCQWGYTLNLKLPGMGEFETKVDLEERAPGGPCGGEGLCGSRLLHSVRILEALSTIQTHSFISLKATEASTVPAPRQGPRLSAACSPHSSEWMAYAGT